MSIFGIPDRSQKVGWKFILAVVVLLGILLGVQRVAGTKAADDLHRVIKFVLAGILVATTLILLLWSRHPANRIVRLLKAGKKDEACAAADDLLKRRPEDPIVRLNAIAAYVAAGKLDEGRRIFEEIKPEALPKGCEPVYAHWKEKFKPAGA